MYTFHSSCIIFYVSIAVSMTYFDETGKPIDGETGFPLLLLHILVGINKVQNFDRSLLRPSYRGLIAVFVCHYRHIQATEDNVAVLFGRYVQEARAPPSKSKRYNWRVPQVLCTCNDIVRLDDTKVKLSKKLFTVLGEPVSITENHFRELRLIA